MWRIRQSIHVGSIQINSVVNSSVVQIGSSGMIRARSTCPPSKEYEPSNLTLNSVNTPANYGVPGPGAGVSNVPPESAPGPSTVGMSSGAEAVPPTVPPSIVGGSNEDSQDTDDGNDQTGNGLQ